MKKIEKNIYLNATHWFDFDKEQMQELLEQLRVHHVGKPAENGDSTTVREKYLHLNNSENSAKIGHYTQEEADKWIEEYNQAMDKNN